MATTAKHVCADARQPASRRGKLCANRVIRCLDRFVVWRSSLSRNQTRCLPRADYVCPENTPTRAHSGWNCAKHAAEEDHGVSTRGAALHTLTEPAVRTHTRAYGRSPNASATQFEDSTS